LRILHKILAYTGSNQAKQMEQESGSTKKSTPTEQIVETVYVKGMLESLKI
jgi:hypothetical protein